MFELPGTDQNSFLHVNPRATCLPFSPDDDVTNTPLERRHVTVEDRKVDLLPWSPGLAAQETVPPVSQSLQILQQISMKSPHFSAIMTSDQREDPREKEKESVMKMFWRIAGIATLVAILGVAAVGAVAFAQDADNGADWPFNFRQRMHDAIANILDVSVEEYDDAVETAQDQVIDQAVTEGWLTQDQADRMRERMEEGLGPRMRGGKFGSGYGAHGFGAGPENSLVGVAADELNMSVQDLVAELQDGKSIAEVAEDKGVDPQSIADAFLDKLAERLGQAVQDEKLTQERADWMLEQAEEHVQERLNEPLAFEGPCPGGFRGGPGMRPGGGFRGFPGQSES
jgi:hypothetical protein